MALVALLDPSLDLAFDNVKLKCKELKTRRVKSLVFAMWHHSLFPILPVGEGAAASHTGPRSEQLSPDVNMDKGTQVESREHGQEEPHPLY